MNYSLCCRSGRRVAVAVIPVTNAVGTFFPVLLAVIFQQFHSSVYSVTGSRVGSSHFPGPSAALRDCRIYFRLTFRCFQVYFFFLLTSCLAEPWLTNLTADMPGKLLCTENSSSEGREDGPCWLYLLIYIFPQVEDCLE